MRFLPVILPILFVGTLVAQYPGLTLPPSGNNQKAEVTQYIGPIRVTIEYSSPAVHTADGKDRRGQIWGKLVPYGLADLGYSAMGSLTRGAPAQTKIRSSRQPRTSLSRANPCPLDITGCI